MSCVLRGKQRFDVETVSQGFVTLTVVDENNSFFLTKVELRFGYL